MYSGTANEYTYRQQARNILDIIVVSDRCDQSSIWYQYIRRTVLNQSLTFFPINVPVQRLYWSDVCTSPTFVSVRRLYQSDVCTSPTFVSVRRLYQSDVCTSPTLVPVRLLSQSVVCTSPTFVPVRLLSQSEVCTSPTFVSPTFELSDICSFRRLWVRCLYWYLQFRTNFYPLMQKINSVNKLKVLILIIKKLMIKII